MIKPSYSDVYDFENLYQAAKETIQDKRLYPEELHFTAHLEEHLIEIQNELIWHTYSPGSYYEFWVYDPKMRLISAPGLKDRVVHTALCRAVDSYIDLRLDYDSYACRKGKGTLKAANRATYYASIYQYYAYFDIRHFFDSVNIGRLEEIYRRRFNFDDEIMALFDIIFMNECNGTGLKKGCRTSQLSANVYLNELDLFIRHKLHAEAYTRLMDDFMIFSNSHAFLEECKKQIADFLKEKLFLTLNAKSHIGETSGGFTFVGYRIFPKYKLVRKTALKRSTDKLKQWKAGKTADTDFYRSAASRSGHCEGTASYKWYCDYLLKALHYALIERKELE